MTQEEYDRYIKLAVEMGKLKGENTALREQLATTAELTALRAEVERLTRERDAERKRIAEALRAEFSDDFGLADRIERGGFAKEDK